MEREKCPLEGDEFAQKELNKIFPNIFFTEKDYEHWIIIDSSKSNELNSQYLIPYGIRIPLINSPEKFVSRLKTALVKYVEDHSHYVLIFDDNGEHYEKIEKYIQKEGIKNIFYLKDGLEGYKAFLQQEGQKARTNMYSLLVISIN